MIKRLGLPTIYKDFVCVADKCTDTCCAGWQVDVDADSWEYYKSVTGEFGDRLRSVMEEFNDGDDSDGDRGCFTLTPSGWCPFLNESLLCDLYSELGGEHLCRTCDNYPRFMEDYGELREMGLALSCPEVSRMVLSSSEPLTYETYPVDNEKLDVNSYEGEDVDSASKVVSDVMVRTRGMSIYDNPLIKEAVEKTYEEGYSIDMEDFDAGYFEMLLTLRETAFSIVKNRELDILSRVILYLDYCNSIQEVIDKDEIDFDDISVLSADCFKVRDRYVNTADLKSRLEELKRSRAESVDLYGEEIAFDEARYRLVPEYGAVIYGELMHCKPEWVPLLNECEEVLHKNITPEEYRKLIKEFSSYMSDREYEYEHALSYHVFRYFLKTYFDDDCYGKGQAAVMQHIMLVELGLLKFYQQGSFSVIDQEYIFHLYSRELEHSTDNYDEFIESLRTESMCNYEHLLNMLLSDGEIIWNN